MQANKITLDAATNVIGKIDLKGSQTNINAGNDVDVELANVGVREKGLIG